VSDYLKSEQLSKLQELLRTFFSLPYSTDLDGKDAETLLKIAKGLNGGENSKRKELFDIVHTQCGYSVKTLRKKKTARRVDLQEQRFCDTIGLAALRVDGKDSPENQGALLLRYMHDRIRGEMEKRKVKEAKSLILLKDWDKERETFNFSYWEEDFIGYIDELRNRNQAGEIEWIMHGAGIHGRDRCRQDEKGNNVRLIRMHAKHNQIFTDHDIPFDAHRFEFKVKRISWEKLPELLLADSLVADIANSSKGIESTLSTRTNKIQASD
jgi:hypothetical protein